MSKKENKEFIEKFMKIKVATICRELGINRGNITNGKASEKNYEMVKNEIERRLDKLYEI